MIGRILRSADFERVLGTPIRARSVHFAVHYLASAPTQAAKPRCRPVPPTALPGQAGCSPALPAQPVSDTSVEARLALAPELSTGVSAASVLLVDDSPPEGVWIGYVVPKRHARRAVTRSLLKRQIRLAAAVQAGPAPHAGLAKGLWVVRLRSPFDRKNFPSARSEALHDVAAAELHALMADAARRVAR